MRNLKFGSIVQIIFFLGLGFLLIWYTSKDLTEEQVQQLKDSWGKTNFVYLLPVLITFMLAHFSRSLRWILLMEPLGYKPRALNTFLAVMIGYFFNLLVPRLGEVMKCTILGKYEQVAPDKLVGTIVAERMIDLVCLLIVTVIMILIQFDVIGEFVFNSFHNLIAAKSGETSWTKLLVLTAGLAAFIFLIRWILRKYGNSGFLLRIKKVLQGVWHGLTSIKKLKHPKLFIFHTVAIWLLYLSSIWIGFKAFPEVAHLGGKAAISILVFGSLGMIATQGGIGAYQLAVEKTLGLYSVAAVTGLAFGWLLWGVQTAITLAAGLICLVLLPLVNRNKKNQHLDPSA